MKNYGEIENADSKKKHGYAEVGIVPTEFNGIPGIQLVLLEKYIG